MDPLKFILRNSLPLNLLMALILVLGLIKTFGMRKEAFPSVDFDMVSVVTFYPGASPKEVEQYVTDVIEDEIENVTGIDTVDSSSIEGMSLIVIKLDPDRTDKEKDKTTDDIQTAIDRIRDLPDEVKDPPLVKTIDSGVMPILEVAITVDGDYRLLHKVAEDLGDEIEALPDIQKVDRNGFREKEFWVEVDPDKLKAHYIPLNLVIGMLSANNLNLPGGVLESDDGDFLVRTIGEFKTVAEIDDIVLRTNASGIKVKVKDIGSTRATFEEEKRYFRTNSRTSVNLLISKKASGDILNLVKDVKQTVKDYKTRSGMGDKVQVSYVNDLSLFVARRLGVLSGNAIFGLILVLGSLLIFLSPGIALVASAGMPIAFVGTLLVMSITGMTINLISMFALVLVLGMLVDDAIIVAENIWQYYEKGERPYDAVLKGTKEVFWPVTSTILTTIAAFSPLLMISGIFGKFIMNMPKVVIIALVISLLEAMIILPPHALDVLKFAEWRKKRRKSSKVNKENEKEVKNSFINRFITKSTESYGYILGFVLRFRYLFLVGIIGVLAGSLWLAKNHVKLVLFPASGVEAFFIRGELKYGTKIDTTSEAISRLEKIVSENVKENELKDFVTIIGVHENDAGDPLKTRGSNLGQIGVFLTAENKREATAFEIIERLRAPIEEEAKKAGIKKVVFEQVRSGPPVGKPIAIRVSGKDLDEIAKVSDLVQEDMKKIEGVKDISENFLPGKDELQVHIDKNQASAALLSVRDIAVHIRAMFEGQVATYVRTGGERIAVRVRYKEEKRKAISAISDSKIANARGIMINLSSVVKIKKTDGISAIVHKDGERSITVSAAINENLISSTEANKALAPYLAKLKQQYPNVTLRSGGEYEETGDSMVSLAQSFIFALLMIYFILSTQFRSLTLPIVVMMAIPFSVIGVITIFYLHNLPLSFLAFIGVIGLSGVVVNDSIVLVDFINKSRERGVAIQKACVDSGMRRFRAVWLTTITTVLGLLPMVYGIGGMDKFLQPAALALGYGLVFGTVLILFFVPSLYMIRVDILNAFRKISSSVVRKLWG